VHAVDAVMRGEVRRAFCATRPPGHHAEPSRPMGFCFFANAVVAARHAIAAHGAAWSDASGAWAVRVGGEDVYPFAVARRQLDGVEGESILAAFRKRAASDEPPPA